MATPLPEDLPERFAIMKKQEVTAYRILDYLRLPTGTTTAPHSAADQQHMSCPECLPSSSSSLAYSGSFATGTTATVTTTTITEDWRAKICEWSYQCIDHFDYDREIVAVSLSYLDRYLCKRPVNRKTYQLAALTSLYLACKLYVPPHQMLPMASFLELGCGFFTEEHIAAMEMSIMNTLGWHMHPPTPLTFARHLAVLHNPNANPNDANDAGDAHFADMMEVTKFLTELAVLHYDLAATAKPSSVGLAALVTAMEVGYEEMRLSPTDQAAFADNVYRVARMDISDPEVTECRIRLRTAYFGCMPGAEAEAWTGPGGVATTCTPTRDGSRTAAKADRKSPTSVVADAEFAAFGLAGDETPPPAGMDGTDARGVGTKKNEPARLITTTDATSTAAKAKAEAKGMGLLLGDDAPLLAGTAGKEEESVEAKIVGPPVGGAGELTGASVGTGLAGVGPVLGVGLSEGRPGMTEGALIGSTPANVILTSYSSMDIATGKAKAKTKGKAMTSARTTIVGKAKKLRKAILSSRKTEEAKKRRMTC